MGCAEGGKGSTLSDQLTGDLYSMGLKGKTVSSAVEFVVRGIDNEMAHLTTGWP